MPARAVIALKGVVAMSDHEQLIRSEFSRQADVMAQAAIFNDANVLARICDAGRLTGSSRVLDVACGPGIVVETLARLAGEVVGCDITPAMLEKARERCDRAGLANTLFTPGRAEALPFEDASFDVVVSRSAVHHFQDPTAAFREMTRVIKSGGRVITVDVQSAEAPEEAALHNALEILRDPSHVRMLPRSELHRSLADAGLEIEEVVAWTNHREFSEWMKIAAAPERVAPLGVVMTALAKRGASAGIGLRLESGKLRFEHSAALTVAIKR
ncbi:MAG TPA: methyltransferase domain-containing protein [Burkholderiales bacterium]|nr:methyltransferase domain-containing protein [Burkholderiales bacterium]